MVEALFLAILAIAIAITLMYDVYKSIQKDKTNG